MGAPCTWRPHMNSCTLTPHTTAFASLVGRIWHHLIVHPAEMLPPISQMRRVRPRQVKELVAVTRRRDEGGLQMSCLLSPKAISSTHISPTPHPPNLTFRVFSCCVFALHALEWARASSGRGTAWSGVGTLSWVLKPTSALLLALLESLGGDLGPFNEPLWTLLTPDHTHCPPSCVSEVTESCQST